MIFFHLVILQSGSVWHKLWSMYMVRDEMAGQKRQLILYTGFVYDTIFCWRNPMGYKHVKLLSTIWCT